MSSITNKILLVEDDIDIQDNLKTFLEMENFEVASVANGKQAIDLMQKEGRPRLILLDLMMPVMNGYEMLAEIKKQNYLKRIRFQLFYYRRQLISKRPLASKWPHLFVNLSLLISC